MVKFLISDQYFKRFKVKSSEAEVNVSRVPILNPPLHYSKF